MVALPEVEAGLPGSAAPLPAAAAVASRLLPAAPIESGPAAASAGTRSCEGEARWGSETEAEVHSFWAGPSVTE